MTPTRSSATTGLHHAPKRSTAASPVGSGPACAPMPDTQVTAPPGRFTLTSGQGGLRSVQNALKRGSRYACYGLRVLQDSGRPLRAGALLPYGHGLLGVVVHPFVLDARLDPDMPGNALSALRLAEAEPGTQLLLLGGAALLTGPGGHLYLEDAAVIRRWRQYTPRRNTPERGVPQTGSHETGNNEPGSHASSSGMASLIGRWRELAAQARTAPHDHREAGEYSAAVWDAAADELQLTLAAHAPLEPGERKTVWKAGFLCGAAHHGLSVTGVHLFPGEQTALQGSADSLYALQASGSYPAVSSRGKR